MTATKARNRLKMISIKLICNFLLKILLTDNTKAMKAIIPLIIYGNVINALLNKACFPLISSKIFDKKIQTKINK